MKNIILLFCLIFSFQSLTAQNIPFTQFEAAPLRLNPALTGTAENGRITSQFESWYGELYKGNLNGTMAVSYDRPFQLKKKHKIGAGIQVYNSQFGSSKYTTKNANLFVSYQRAVATDNDRSNYLIVGVNGGFSQKKTSDFLALQWGTQHDGMGGFDGTLTSLEELERDSDKSNYPTLGAGFAWIMKKEDGTSFELGIAVDNINEPTTNFNNTNQINNNIGRTTQLHLLVDFKVNNSINFQPKLRYLSEGANVNTIFGGNVVFSQENERKSGFILGGGILIQNSLSTENFPMFNLGYQQNNIQIMLGTLIYAGAVRQTFNTTHGTFYASAQYLFGTKEEVLD